jgi:hypothetical protein
MTLLGSDDSCQHVHGYKSYMLAFNIFFPLLLYNFAFTSEILTVCEVLTLCSTVVIACATLYFSKRLYFTHRLFVGFVGFSG